MRSCLLVAILCAASNFAFAADTPATTQAIDAARLQMAREYLDRALPLLGKDALVPAITLNDLAQVQAALGDFTQARIIALRNDGLSMRIISLAAIATQQWRAGDVEGSRDTFAGAFRLALTIKSGDPNPAATDGVQSSLFTIGNAQLLAGDVEEAQHTLDEMSTTSMKAMLLKDFGEITAKHKDAAKAARYFAEAYAMLKAVREAGHETSPDLSADSIARSQAESGDVAGAKLAVEQMNDKEERSAALASIALCQLHDGDSGGALHTLDASAVALLAWLGEHKKVNESFGELVGNMALARSRLGDSHASAVCFNRAIAAAFTIDGDKWTSLLPELAYQQKEAGDVAGGIDTIRRAIALAGVMKDRAAGVHAVWEIAIKQASHHDEAGALHTIQVDMPAGMMELIDAAFEAGALAREQTRWNGARAQLDWIDKLPTPDERCYVYSEAAAGLVEPHGDE